MTGVLKYLRRHHVGLLALFVALGGTSYAAVNLPRNSVGTRQLRNRAVTTSKLAKGAVNASKVRAGSLLARDFKPGQIHNGPVGPQGPQGPQGRQGSQGPKGATGPTGPATGPAGGALTGSYPNPSLAAGSVSTTDFAAGAQAPDAAKLAGEPATHYLHYANDGQAGFVPVETFGYFLNTSGSATYPFVHIALKTVGTSGEFELCGDGEPYVMYVKGTRSAGTLPSGGCTLPQTVGSGGDFTIYADRMVIFGTPGGDPQDYSNYDAFGFAQP